MSNLCGCPSDDGHAQCIQLPPCLKHVGRTAAFSTHGAPWYGGSGHFPCGNDETERPLWVACVIWPRNWRLNVVPRSRGAEHAFRVMGGFSIIFVEWLEELDLIVVTLQKACEFVCVCAEPLPGCLLQHRYHSHKSTFLGVQWSVVFA